MQLLPLTAVALALPLLARPQDTRASESDRTDILLITIDDAGLELFGAYADVLRDHYRADLPDATPTPHFDALFESGMRFERFIAYPMCSPARAALMTGRHGFRTGIGSPTNLRHRPPRIGLQPEELCLPEALTPAGYATGAFGKWHLAAGRGTLKHPIEAAGFDYFEGHLYNVVIAPQTLERSRLSDFSHWPEVTASAKRAKEAMCDRHQTVEVVDDTLRWVEAQDDPWFAYVNFQAIHSPLEDPTGELPDDASNPEKGRAMLRFLDEHLGRLLAGVSHPREDLVVILLGDNGTAHPVILGNDGCFVAQKSKSSLYHGGLDVPFVIAGGLAPKGASTRELACITDVFATVCELAGVALPAEAADSVSLVPALRGAEVARTYRYAQEHRPNVYPFAVEGLRDWERAVDDGAFKLIRRAGKPDELYDLRSDPCENVDLFPPAEDTEADAAFERLVAELERLGVS